MTTVTPPSTDLPRRTVQVALVGNPNVGKTTLFNRLTGSRQRVGNYPGVTVEKKLGVMTLCEDQANVVDLPGTYSLAAASRDERVVIDALEGHIDGTPRPDVVVCVVDATNLMRNLFLASQIADLGIPSVVALNMMDAAREQGITIDPKMLAERLGVPVVPMVASKGRGIDDLKNAVRDAVDSDQAIAPMPWPESVETAVAELAAAIERDTGQALERPELLRVLFDYESAIPDRVGWTPEQREQPIATVRRRLEEDGLDPFSAEAILRFGRLGELLEGVFSHPTERKATAGESVDRLLTHRVWGLVIFVGLMWLVFESLYTFAGPLMDGIEAATGWVSGLVAPALASTPVLQSLVVDGVIGGVGAVVIFLPQILILFFFIALLEDTGYMARAAFLMDKLFSWCGLNGKSFVPMLSSYACAVPGVMATRSIEDPKARLVTILIAPLMSCSARLPVYVLLIGAFIEPTYGPWVAGAALVAMHFVGLIVAIPVALFLNRFVVKGTRIPFVMEMPPYRTPNLRDVFWRMWQSGSKFLKRAGTIIFAMMIIIWALGYFPRPDSVKTDFAQEVASVRNVSVEQAERIIETDYSNELAGRYLEQSYLGRLGKTLQPIFAPAGYDWKITVGVISSFPARETIIGTLGLIYNLGADTDEESEGLVDALRSATWRDGDRKGEPVYSPLVAFSIMVFFALCLQCGSTVAVMAREATWGWAIFGFIYMTILAWLGAVVVYQVGSLLF